MSLPALLRRVGVNVPRGITINGRVVVGAEATQAVAAGTATLLRAHTFHGGENPEQPDATAPWWDDAVARAVDVAAVAAAFPGFTLDDTDGRYVWRGLIDTGRGRFTVEIVGSPSRSLPRVVPTMPHRLGRPEGRRFRKSDHLYLNGDLCVADQDDWLPAEHTTATVIAWAAHWYAAYTEWRMSGVWPTLGYSRAS